MIYVAPAHDLSATGGYSCGKLIFMTRFSIKEIGEDKCCP